MNLIITGGKHNGKTLEHDSPGWEKIYSVKIDDEFYLVDLINSESAWLRYSDNQSLPLGRSARLLALTPEPPKRSEKVDE